MWKSSIQIDRATVPCMFACVCGDADRLTLPCLAFTYRYLRGRKMRLEPNGDISQSSHAHPLSLQEEEIPDGREKS